MAPLHMAIHIQASCACRPQSIQASDTCSSHVIEVPSNFTLRVQQTQEPAGEVPSRSAQAGFRSSGGLCSAFCAPKTAHHPRKGDVEAALRSALASIETGKITQLLACLFPQLLAICLMSVTLESRKGEHCSRALSHASVPTSCFFKALVVCSGRQALAGIKQANKAGWLCIFAGLSASGILLHEAAFVQLWIRDMADFARVNAVYKEYFPMTRPAARACIQAPLSDGALVAVEVVLPAKGKDCNSFGTSLMSLMAIERTHTFFGGTMYQHQGRLYIGPSCSSCIGH